MRTARQQTLKETRILIERLGCISEEMNESVSDPIVGSYDGSIRFVSALWRGRKSKTELPQYFDERFKHFRLLADTARETSNSAFRALREQGIDTSSRELDDAEKLLGVHPSAFQIASYCETVVTVLRAVGIKHKLLAKDPHSSLQCRNQNARGSYPSQSMMRGMSRLAGG
jgi:hypothetical protein